MKCVLFSTIIVLLLITIGIVYFYNLGGFNSNSQNEYPFKQVLSCVKIGNQLINELQLYDFDTKTFQYKQDKYSQHGTDISNIECQDDLEFCKTTTIEIIADALQVKFSFNCTTNRKEGEEGIHHCDQWDYFDIYLHCDAKDKEHLLPVEDLWELENCKLKKVENVQCDVKCLWTHEITRRSRIFKRQAIAADTRVQTITPPTTIPSNTELTTAAVTTPTMATSITAMPSTPAAGTTTRPKKRTPAHCLRKPVGPPTGPITTSTPSTMTVTTPSTMIGTASATTPSIMIGTESTTTTMTGTGSTTQSTMTEIGSTTSPSTMIGNGSTTTGTGSTTASTMTGTGSTTTTPSNMIATTTTTLPTTTTATTTTKAPPPPPPPPPPPRPAPSPPPCKEKCRAFFRWHQACNGRCFWCNTPSSKVRRYENCPPIFIPIPLS